MTFGPAVGNVGMYVAREMLVSVPEDQRQAYLRMVEELSDLKYQLRAEVAPTQPRPHPPRGSRTGIACG